MTKVAGVLSRDEVLTRFRQIQEEQKAREAAMATRDEVALRTQRESVVEQALGYTVEGIVHNLAALQLKVGDELDTLSNILMVEASKLDQIRTALEIEEERARELESSRVAAEALALLGQSHQREREQWEDRAHQLRSTLEEEMTTERAKWKEEQRRHDDLVTENEQKTLKERKRSEEVWSYTLAQTRKREADAYQKRKVDLERELLATSARKEADWTAREAFLASKADELKALTERDVAFPEELKAAVDRERTAAIRKANDESKVTAQLAERDAQSSLQICEAQIEMLTKQLETQSEQIRSLMSQLSIATAQSQELAVKAIDSARPGRENHLTN
jgi:hypothetical protein